MNILLIGVRVEDYVYSSIGLNLGPSPSSKLLELNTCLYRSFHHFFPESEYSLKVEGVIFKSVLVSTPSHRTSLHLRIGFHMMGMYTTKVVITFRLGTCKAVSCWDVVLILLGYDYQNHVESTSSSGSCLTTGSIHPSPLYHAFKRALVVVQ